jgi:hypothetical protein
MVQNIISSVMKIISIQEKDNKGIVCDKINNRAVKYNNNKVKASRRTKAIERAAAV